MTKLNWESILRGISPLPVPVGQLSRLSDYEPQIQ